MLPEFNRMSISSQFITQALSNNKRHGYPFYLFSIKLNLASRVPDEDKRVRPIIPVNYPLLISYLLLTRHVFLRIRNRSVMDVLKVDEEGQIHLS